MTSPHRSRRDRIPTRDLIARATRRGRDRIGGVDAGADVTAQPVAARGPSVDDAVRGTEAIGVVAHAADAIGTAIPGAAGAAAPPAPDPAPSRARLPISMPALRILTWLVFAAVLGATLALGRAFLAPIAIAAFLAVLLAPLARRLRRIGVPAPIAAAVLSVGLTAAVVGALYAAMEPANRIIAAMPATIDRAARQLDGVRGPMGRLERTAEAIERATGAGTPTPGPGTRVIAAVPAGKNIAQLLYGTTSSIIFGAAQVFAMLFVLLASTSAPATAGAPTERQAQVRWRLAAMYHEAQTECLRFMSLLAVTNVFYGVCVGTALGLLGLPNPLLWGIGATIVEFVPVLGMISYMAILAVVALGTFGTLGGTIGALVTVFLINFVVMNLVAPLFMGKKMSVHPVLLVAAVFFWTWTWGLAGAFLATPLVLTGRVLVRRLGWLGELASPDPEPADDAEWLRAQGRRVRTELVSRLRGSRAATVPGVAPALGGATRTTE